MNPFDRSKELWDRFCTKLGNDRDPERKHARPDQDIVPRAKKACPDPADPLPVSKDVVGFCVGDVVELDYVDPTWQSAKPWFGVILDATEFLTIGTVCNSNQRSVICKEATLYERFIPAHLWMWTTEVLRISGPQICGLNLVQKPAFDRNAIEHIFRHQTGTVLWLKRKGGAAGFLGFRNWFRRENRLQDFEDEEKREARGAWETGVDVLIQCLNDCVRRGGLDHWHTIPDLQWGGGGGSRTMHKKATSEEYKILGAERYADNPRLVKLKLMWREDGKVYDGWSGQLLAEHLVETKTHPTVQEGFAFSPCDMNPQAWPAEVRELHAPHRPGVSSLYAGACESLE